MDQRESMVGKDIDIQAYYDAVDRLREEFARAQSALVQFKMTLASNYLDEENRNKLSESMEPFKNFVENKTKATILCTGSISSGKSSLLNSLLGDCILPSGQMETTETITKLIPSQELNSNTCYMIKDNGEKLKFDVMDIYQHHQEQNIQEKQKTENPILLEIETNFLVLNNFKENPLLQRHQLEFVDLPGCDSTNQGKDQRFSDYSSKLKLGDSPNLILFIISPENISKKSTRQFLHTERDVLSKKINDNKRVQKEFYTILQGIKGKEVINENDNENTEKLVQSRLCIVISKFDLLRPRETKDIQEQFLTEYKILPNFASFKKQIEYNTLRHRITPHNIRILLNDEEMEKQALQLLPKDRQAILRKQEISSWTEGDIKNVLDNAAKLFQRQFEDEDDGTVEASTRMQQLVLQIMIKITNECTQYLRNYSRRIEYLSEVFSIGLDEKIIDQQIIPKDYDLFLSACDQCYKDLERSKIILQEEYKKQLNDSIIKVKNTFMEVQSFVTLIQQNSESFDKETFEQKLVDIFQKRLEDAINELQENMKKSTKGAIEITVQSIKRRMPFLKEEIHTKISQMFQAQMLARFQVYKLNLYTDDIQQIGQQIRSLTSMLVLSESSKGGKTLVDTIGWFGLGAILLIGGVMMSAASRRNKIIKIKQEITQTLASEENKLIQSLTRNQEDNYKSNSQDLSKGLEKVLQGLYNAYAYKIHWTLEK